MTFGAVLFDLDGVITPTAVIHERAWADLFAPWGFTNADYLAYVDGRPRYDGVRTFLASRGVELPWGDPSDPPGDDTICALGNRKDEMFNAVLAREGIAPYPGSMAVLDRLDELGMPSAIVSSSKNARTVLQAAGIEDRFDAVVDGNTLVERAPRRASPIRRCSSTPPRCLDVAPAQSGRRRGRDLGRGRRARRQLRARDRGRPRRQPRRRSSEAGADIVVDDLGETLA